MKNLFIILLLVPITLFGQVKKEVTQEQSYDDVNLNLLNNQFQIEQIGRGFQVLGLGMISYGFLSNYALSQKGINNEDLNSSEVKSRLEKSQNNELISGLGALISCIGVVIPMDLNGKNAPRIAAKNNGQLHVLNGVITFVQINSTFRKGDKVIVKTLNGPVITKGILNDYFSDRIEITSDEGLNFTLYLNILEYIELVGLR